MIEGLEIEENYVKWDKIYIKKEIRHWKKLNFKKLKNKQSI